VQTQEHHTTTSARAEPSPEVTGVISDSHPKRVHPKEGCLHTPGPWAWNGNRLGPVNKDPDAGHVHSILDAEGGHGYLMSKPSDTLAQLDADYLLIAAAPDLLAVCQRLAESAAYWSEYDVPLGIVAALNAAIGKATGAAA